MLTNSSVDLRVTGHSEFEDLKKLKKTPSPDDDDDDYFLMSIP